MEAGAMTTPTPLREALAAALQRIRDDQGVERRGLIVTDPAIAADAILAAPSMQAVAEHEAVGRAVARLPDGMIVISPPHDRHPDKWLVRVYDHDADEDDAERFYGEGPTFHAAVAALGPSEGERT